MVCTKKKVIVILNLYVVTVIKYYWRGKECAGITPAKGDTFNGPYQEDSY